MKKKKVLVGLGLVILLGVTVGCGSQKNTTASSVSSVEKTTVKESTNTESSEEKSEETVNTSQETAASSTTESSAPAVEAPKTMNLAEIRSGNYASLAGTWQNALGATITITDTTMTFSDLTSFGKAGTVTGTTVDIPADNAPDGSPKMVEAFGGQGPAYEKQLDLEDNGSYLVLRGSVPGAGLFISFYPPGASGTARSGDINQERIIALVTQADLVTEAMAYHRVN